MEWPDSKKRRGIAKQYVMRLYERHKIMIRKLAAKKGVSEAEIVRQAVEAMYLKEA